MLKEIIAKSEKRSKNEKNCLHTKTVVEVGKNQDHKKKFKKGKLVGEKTNTSKINKII